MNATSIELMPFAAAQQAIVDACDPLATETIALERALGRVAARDVVAREMLVPFARSAMDGYAVRSADATSGAVLAIAATFAAAGSVPPELAAGTAMPIATGAPIPPGADAVVPIEDTTNAADAVVRIDTGVAAGDHVFPPGEDAMPGQLLVRAGTRLRAADLGILAASGEARVIVYLRPRVTLLSSGDELVPLDATPGYGQIRDSNVVTLAQALGELGAHVVGVHHVADTEAAMTRALARALAVSDLVVTTGGASVGKRDFVKRVARSLDVRFVFETIAMRPSKPSAFGSVGFAHLVVLPGNPAAAFVALHELARPALARLAGERRPLMPRVTARLASGTVRAKAGRTFCAYARLGFADDGFTADLLDNQCSSLVKTAADANAFLVIPDGAATYGPGDRVVADIFDFSTMR